MRRHRRETATSKPTREASKESSPCASSLQKCENVSSCCLCPRLPGALYGGPSALPSPSRNAEDGPSAASPGASGWSPRLSPPPWQQPMCPTTAQVPRSPRGRAVFNDATSQHYLTWHCLLPAVPLVLAPSLSCMDTLFGGSAPAPY